MDKKKEKCPACGLVNFRDAAQCQWCALALRGHARTELIDDLPRADHSPWGLLLILFAVAVIGGGIFWHVTRMIAERAESVAETLESADAAAPAKPAKRAGPPKLSGRSPSDNTPDGEIRGLEELRQNGLTVSGPVGVPQGDLYQFDERRMRQEEIRRTFQARRAREQLEGQERAQQQPAPSPDW